MKNNEFENFHDYYDLKEDIRKCIIIIALDKSGSMKVKEEVVYQAIVDLLKMLAKKNETELDCEFVVILMTFNTTVNVINKNNVPLPPEQVLELFGRNDYECSGGTSLAAVFQELDAMFSRKGNGLLKDAKKGDAYPLVIFISDYVATDEEGSYNHARDVLLSNRFYEKTNRLCIFVGSGYKEGAVELVGSEKCVIALNQNLEGLLAPVMMGSTIMMEATHIGEASKEPADIAEEQQKRAEDGMQSADKLKDEDLEKKLREIFEKKGIR